MGICQHALLGPGNKLLPCEKGEGHLDLGRPHEAHAPIDLEGGKDYLAGHSADAAVEILVRWRRAD